MAQRTTNNDGPEGGPVSAAFNLSGGGPMASKQLQHAWFELTRSRPWRSMALVPTEDGTATLSLAHQLALFASQDPRQKVLVVNATGIVGRERPTTSQMANQVFGNSGVVPMGGGKYGFLDCAKLGLDDATVGMVEVPKYVDQMRQGTGAFTQMLVATSSVMSKPTVVASARAVDTVVLCVSLGSSSFADAHRTIELIGEENIAGSLALKSRR
jgi:hypothetical protein